MVLCLFSCGQLSEEDELLLGLEGLEELDMNQHSAVLILPSVGCAGCISSVEQFVKDKKFSNLLLILTNTMSRKDAEHRLGLIDPNCKYYFDAQKEFFIANKEESAYPVIIYLDKDKITSSEMEFISPENAEALFNLETHLYDTM